MIAPVKPLLFHYPIHIGEIGFVGTCGVVIVQRCVSLPVGLFKLMFRQRDSLDDSELFLGTVAQIYSDSSRLRR
jgi:hypothetical protein